MLRGSIIPNEVLQGRINALERIRGYSAYEIAKKYGFEGTEEEWLNSLKPVKGEDYWTAEDQEAIRADVAPVVIYHGPDNMCNYTASEIYDIAEALLNGDSAKTIWLFWRGTWLIPYSGTDEHGNACFERTFVDEDGKPVLVTFRIDQDGWLTRTDTYLPAVDNTKVGDDLWSSKNIVDKLCPSFQQSDFFVTCEPVEGYPLAVQAQPGLATEVTRCGKNLFDKSESKLSRLSYKDTSGNNVEIFGFEFMLPPGTYVLKAQSKESAKEGYIYGLTYDSSGKYTGEWNAAWGTNLTAKIKTFTDVTRVIIYDAVNRPVSGAVISYAWATFKKWDIQLEVGNTATEFEPYNGAIFPMTENADGVPVATVPALAGINHLWVDDGELTVTGKADPVAIIHKLSNALGV